MSRILFHFVIAAGLSCSAAAFAQTRNVMPGTAAPAVHTTSMAGPMATGQNSMSHHVNYTPDRLHTGNAVNEAMQAAPTQEFLDSVGR